MSLWTLFLIIVGALGIHGECPPAKFIYPCTCEQISDKFGVDFSVVTCRNIHSEDVLMQVLSVTRGKKLFEFQIVDSYLRFIPHDAFVGTTFEVVSFENSSITALSDAGFAFEGLEDFLRLIEIHNCSFVSNWDWTQLSHLRHMMEISVTHTDLLDIANGLASVQHLELEAVIFKGNNIQWLDNYVFSPFQQLTRITLDRNQIERLDRTMFPRPAKKLKIVGVSYNKLRALPEDIFVDMPALTSLYLTGNPLQVIEETTFRPIWYQLKLFFFYDTKLSCDCRLAWITREDNSGKYIHSVCNSPAHVRGRNIQSMQTHELCRLYN